MSEVCENLNEVLGHVSAACLRAGRNRDSVQLIAVSKTFPADAVRDAVEAGQDVFGESKLQEAEPKIAALPGSLHWHFIGRVQRNKVRKLLQNFEVIHAIDSLRLAAYADEIAGELGLFPQVFLQVNVAGEQTKGGFEPDMLRAEMDSLLKLKRLEIIGLMCIPPAGPDAGSARPWFVALRELRDSLEAEFSVELPALSMGMSGDYEVAIEEGATHVRVGSAIFGKRAYRVDGELG
ncbi:YggS family pyridoxal phosphate-dependent enzyme [Luteolibacter yonseiensis]|uniref:Pyridoxal phosphate homeostasis protein n=1 Tax=Luteolibacter yonseiensis TaxID=1144680 RepID=A0A934R421_9BACT|nr:YggS family pyridoxal phosphate-dependent enzyme [Luteolibacter yonseiensis]MBK1816731.1 YggS family pyridoxal phosphate-dependent enzyme [Luteolibacter yonseiensis]